MGYSTREIDLSDLRGERVKCDTATKVKSIKCRTLKALMASVTAGHGVEVVQRDDCDSYIMYALDYHGQVIYPPIFAEFQMRS